ncbi:MAG: alpha/beta hydrolase family protein [Acidimicrobiales bacterium]
MSPSGRSRPERALVLTPGAGSGADHPCLVAIEERLAPGIPVARVDFPYRLAGRRAPDRPPVLISTVRDAAGELSRRHGLAPARVVLGGRSMGGRMCSMAAADGLPALALVLISYPLHPPGRPERSRVEHLARLDLPCLFVSGTRDAFGTPAELEAATQAIPGPVTLSFVDGGDHSLRGRDALVADQVAAWVRGLEVR